MSFWLSVAVIVVCIVYGLVAAGYAIRDRILDDRLLLLLGILEVLLVVQAVVGVVLGARSTRDFEAPVFYAYLLTVPFVAPFAGFLAIKDKSRWSMGVVVGSALVVGVFIGRLNQIWTPMPDPTPAPSPGVPPDASGDGRDGPSPAARHTGKGPGIVLVALYALFALAATGRATLQIIADFQKAPIAYLLSGLAAVIYLVATVALARGDRTSARVARVAISIELAGVLVVGLVSYLVPSEFPDKTVWSHFGSGYGYVPLVLPVLGLLWLRRTQAAH